VTSRDSASIAIVRKNETGFSSQVTPANDDSERSFGAVLADDGRVWIAFDLSLRVFDPTTVTLTDVVYAFTPLGITKIEGKVFVIRRDSTGVRGERLDQLDEADPSSGTILKTIATPVGAGFQSHWIAVAR
jgi:hypothetical protein